MNDKKRKFCNWESAIAPIPVEITMGAMVEFEDMKGKGPHEASTFKDACQWLYCHLVSGCIRAKIPFEMDFREFSHSCTPEVINQWMEFTQSGNTEDTKKRIIQRTINNRIGWNSCWSDGDKIWRFPCNDTAGV